MALPKEISSIEGDLHELLKKSFERGKLQLTVRLEGKSTAQAGKVGKRFLELKKACRLFKVSFSPDARLVADLLKENPSTSIDEAAAEAETLAIVKTAIKNCQAAQASEGARLKKDFTARVGILGELKAQAQKLSEGTVRLQRDRLLKNLAQAGLTVDLSDERLLKELALFADRVDISEEITRIGSHLEALQKLIASSGAIGRQLEFLLQELLREWNTLGNKSPRIELVRLSLGAKNEIERMKEQSANVI